MRRWSRRVFSPTAWRAAALVAACTALVVELFGEFTAPAAQQFAVASGSALPQTTPASVPQPPSSDVIEKHPLFHPTRTPWMPPPPVSIPQPVQAMSVAPPVPPLRNYALAGLVLSGEIRSALVHAANGNKTIVLREGQTLDGWTLVGISGTGLHFEAGGSQYDMGFPIALKGGSR